MEKPTLHFSQEAIDFINSLFKQGEDEELIYISQHVAFKAFWSGYSKGSPTTISKDFFEKHFNFVKSLKTSDNEYNYNLLKLQFYNKDPDVCKVAADTHLELFLEDMEKKYPSAPNKEIAEFIKIFTEIQTPEAEQIRKEFAENVLNGDVGKAFDTFLLKGVNYLDRLYQLKEELKK